MVSSVAQTYTLGEALSSATSAAESGDLRRAELIAHAVIDHFPKCLDAHRALAEIYHRQARHVEALAEYERVSAMDPLDFKAYSAIASIYMRDGQATKAGRYLDLARDHASGRYGNTGSVVPLSPARLAILNERSRLYPQAIDQIGQIIGPSSDRLDLYLVLARALFFSRLWQPAEDAIVAILASAPDCLQANVIAACLAARNGNRDVARTHLNRAFRVDPSGKEVWLLAAGYLAEDLLERTPGQAPQARSAETAASQGVPPDASEDVPAMDEAAKSDFPEAEPAPVSEAGITSDQVAGSGHQAEPPVVLEAGVARDEPGTSESAMAVSPQSTAADASPDQVGGSNSQAVPPDVSEAGPAPDDVRKPATPEAELPRESEPGREADAVEGIRPTVDHEALPDSTGIAAAAALSGLAFSQEETDTARAEQAPVPPAETLIEQVAASTTSQPEPVIPEFPQQQAGYGGNAGESEPVSASSDMGGRPLQEASMHESQGAGEDLSPASGADSSEEGGEEHATEAPAESIPTWEDAGDFEAVQEPHRPEDSPSETLYPGVGALSDSQSLSDQAAGHSPNETDDRDQAAASPGAHGPGWADVDELSETLVNVDYLQPEPSVPEPISPSAYEPDMGADSGLNDQLPEQEAEPVPELTDFDIWFEENVLKATAAQESAREASFEDTDVLWEQPPGGLDVHPEPPSADELSRPEHGPAATVPVYMDSGSRDVAPAAFIYQELEPSEDQQPQPTPAPEPVLTEPEGGELSPQSTLEVRKSDLTMGEDEEAGPRTAWQVESEPKLNEPEEVELPPAFAYEVRESDLATVEDEEYEAGAAQQVEEVDAPEHSHAEESPVTESGEEAAALAEQELEPVPEPWSATGSEGQGVAAPPAFAYEIRESDFLSITIDEDLLAPASTDEPGQGNAGPEDYAGETGALTLDAEMETGPSVTAPSYQDAGVDAYEAIETEAFAVDAQTEPGPSATAPSDQDTGVEARETAEQQPRDFGETYDQGHAGSEAGAEGEAGEPGRTMSQEAEPETEISADRGGTEVEPVQREEEPTEGEPEEIDQIQPVEPVRADSGFSRPWAMEGSYGSETFEPPRSKLADMAEVVVREPLNNGARYALARELENSGEHEQAVVQYSLIVTSRDPRLIEDVLARLESLVAGGAKIRGLQRLLGDSYMQLGSFERAIEAYSVAFDELRSRQITDKGRKL